MVHLDRLLTLYCFSFLHRRGLSGNGVVPILMYHSISDEPERGHPYFWTNTSVKRFTAHMQFLKSNHYRVLSLAEVAAYFGAAAAGVDGARRDGAPARSLPFPDDARRHVALTFDDGFRDFHDRAWPVLASFGFPATVFVPTAFIGNRRKAFNGRMCLTWPEIRELRSQGVSFGSHTATHALLHGLRWSELRRELLDSRLRLEQELHTPAACFAYPYAFPQEDRSFVLRFRQELVDAGYRTAVTTRIGCADPASDLLGLERLPINERDDEALLAAKLAGAYDWLAVAQALARRAQRFRRRGPVLLKDTGSVTP